ncbi:Lrp/AsnC family transcriptional regulator [Caenispirillum bisanense]|uniref:siroheme decarboxylase subunit beta n=1 Tax=Caenispirillum bisanense TaxID=414052 RepID=UPI0031D20349
MTQPILLDATDRALVTATQDGLPLLPDPYGAVAEAVGIARAEVIGRLERMLAAGVIRRIGAVPNHYRLGFRANGMTVWDVDDDRVMALGQAVGDLPFVSHCYLRPRVAGLWSYNLFAMVHGHDRAEAESQAGQIRALLGEACRGGEILYSTRILKKTGLRLRASAGQGG